MSNQNPNQRRRRIAGERKGARPAPPDASGPEPTEPPATGDERTPAGADDSPPAPPPPPAPPVVPERSRRPVPLPVLVVLGVVTAALVVVATVGVADGMGVQGVRAVQEQEDVAGATRTAPAAAERAAQAILAYDYKTLEADRDAAARFMTDGYRKEYLDTFGLVLKNAPDLKAVVKAQVKASGVAHADPGRANVLLYVNQTTTSTANSGEPQMALNRVMFAMVKVGDTWLVNDITSY